jgi:hypothetical protein
MKPAQYDAYIQMLRYGSDGPFMRGNRAEYALLVHCTKLNEEEQQTALLLGSICYSDQLLSSGGVS